MSPMKSIWADAILTPYTILIGVILIVFLAVNPPFIADYMGDRRPDRLGESAARRMEHAELRTSSGGR